MNDIMAMKLVDNIGERNICKGSIRQGFGDGLVQAAANNSDVVGLSADLRESIKMNDFAKNFQERYIEIGVAEQNLVTVAAGLAAMGKHPFAGSYAAFCPGRCWEQIRTTICLNNVPVTIVGSHAGINVGPDGATHQMLEDVALMRSLPNMIVVSPGDQIEAQKATIALAKINKPSYLRLARSDSPIFTTQDTPFEVGKAYVLWAGSDLTLISTGIMTYSCLVSAKKLLDSGISVEVIHAPTIKPLDSSTILASVHRTGRVITVEDGQIAGGLGGAIAELLADKLPVPVKRLGINNEFGQSGSYSELLEHFRLKPDDIASQVRKFIT